MIISYNFLDFTGRQWVNIGSTCKISENGCVSLSNYSGEMELSPTSRHPKAFPLKTETTASLNVLYPITYRRFVR